MSFHTNSGLWEFITLRYDPQVCLGDVYNGRRLVIMSSKKTCGMILRMKVCLNCEVNRWEIIELELVWWFGSGIVGRCYAYSVCSRAGPLYLGPASRAQDRRATHSYQVNNLFIIPQCYVTILSASSARQCVPSAIMPKSVTKVGDR